MNEMALSASLEDYLEAIYNIVSDKGGVRAKDIAHYLNVKAGSVTSALQTLAKSGLVNYQPYEVISLTDKGLEEAKRVIRKHEILQDFFEDVLGAEKKVAQEGACRIEHVIPDDLVEKLISFTEFLYKCPRCSELLLERFRNQLCLVLPGDRAQCDACIDDNISVLQKQKEKIESPAALANLAEIPCGRMCIVKNINRDASEVKRLIEMGISRGAVVEVERIAPLGDPIEIKVKGYHLSIRKDQAESIIVENID